MEFQILYETDKYNHSQMLRVDFLLEWNICLLRDRRQALPGHSLIVGSRLVLISQHLHVIIVYQ